MNPFSQVLQGSGTKRRREAKQKKQRKICGFAELHLFVANVLQKTRYANTLTVL